MQDLAKPSREMHHWVLFRATDAWAILSGWGKVWRNEAHPADESHPETQMVARADVFVSHSWADDPWQKHLAMCFFLNYSFALKATAAALALSLAALFLLLPCDPSLNTQFLMVLDVPMIVFFAAFFAGQHCTGWWSPIMWMDRLCIDQTDVDTKMEGISVLPAIVSSSEQMLVLLGETYFDRLWCSFELSIFVKLRCLGQLRVVPLWLTPWLLTSLLSSYITMRLTALRLFSSILCYFDWLLDSYYVTTKPKKYRNFPSGHSTS